MFFNVVIFLGGGADHSLDEVGPSADAKRRNVRCMRCNASTGTTCVQCRGGACERHRENCPLCGEVLCMDYCVGRQLTRNNQFPELMHIHGTYMI